jgi:hypothetical protein
LTKVVRKIFYMGALYTISFALESDGVTSPAENALKLMLTGNWPEDPEAAKEGFPSDTQIDRRAQLVAGIKYFARNGVPAWSQCGVNALRDGIWEFKEGEKRISFFDTDGSGNYTPKRKFKDREKSDYPDDPDWEIPSFERDVRLGHCFGKPWGQRTTEQEDLDESARVRMEDLAHDKAA